MYSTVLNRLDPSKCPLISDDALLVRAGKAISNARALGADIFIKPKVCIVCVLYMCFINVLFLCAVLLLLLFLHLGHDR